MDDTTKKVGIKVTVTLTESLLKQLRATQKALGAMNVHDGNEKPLSDEATIRFLASIGYKIFSVGVLSGHTNELW